VHTRPKGSASVLVAWYSLGMVLLIACQQPDPALAESPATNAVPEAEADKTFYALGAILGTSLKQFDLSESELGWVQRGIVDQAMGREVAVNPEDYGAQLQKLQQERTKSATVVDPDSDTVAFLEEQSAMDGAVVSESGLIMHELTAGEGASPASTDTVVVHYHGTLVDGTVFDSSVDRGSPARFPLNRVIPCWTEGVAKMKVGGKSRLVCPPQIAYGARGSGKIPPNAAIVFEVELLEIE
jgi:FKBP-type peptidyl-prolyl cis-trans isomerase FkpA